MTYKAGIVMMVGFVVLNMLWASKVQGAALLRTKRDNITPDGSDINGTYENTTSVDIDAPNSLRVLENIEAPLIARFGLNGTYENTTSVDIHAPTISGVLENVEPPLTDHNIIYDIVKEMTEGIETLESVLMKIKNGTQQIDMPIDELLGQTKIIATRKAKLKLLTYDEDRVYEEYVQILLGIKHKLRLAKHDLIAIAYKVVSACKDVLIFMDGWDASFSTDEQKAYLQEQLDAIRKAMDTTKATLERTTITYDHSIVQLDKLGSGLNSFEHQLEDMLDDKHIAHKNWTENVRIEIYSRMAKRTSGFSKKTFQLFEDPVKFFEEIVCPSCSKEEASKAAISRVEVELEAIKEATNSSVIAINSARDALNELQSGFGTNLQTIRKWNVGVTKMNDTIAVAVDDDFHQLSTLRKEFHISVNRLLTKGNAFPPLDKL